MLLLLSINPIPVKKEEKSLDFSATSCIYAEDDHIQPSRLTLEDYYGTMGVQMSKMSISPVSVALWLSSGFIERACKND